MCDIYQHKCDHNGCNVKINIHLEDFATKHNEIEVFCGSHIPNIDDRINGTLWKVKHNKSHSKIFVRSLTENAKKHWSGNCYNGNCECIEAFGKLIKRNR